MNKALHFLLPALLAGISCAFAAAAELPKEKTEELIHKLAEIDTFDTGFSSTHGGTDFPPVAGQFEFGVGRLFADEAHERKKTVTFLVEAGPSALPVLLEHLNDERPTKLTVTHDQGFGAMWHAAEIRAPEYSKPEAEAIEAAKLPKEDFATRETLNTYQVKVGDICFAIIGMITNRSYNAVRYQPTACIILNSPVKTPEIATALRAIWKDHADTSGLRASLERDFDNGNNGAATRLLYYFPAESSARVNARLKDLIAKKDDGLSRFLNAVAWAPDADLRTQIRTLLSSSKDAGIVVSGAAAYSDTANPALRDEVVKLFQRWKTDKKDSEREAAGKLLAVAMNAWADRSGDTLAAYLSKADRAALIAGIQACYESGSAPVEPLRRLLDDKREGFGYYLKDGPGAQDQPRREDYRPYRICDHAYELICRGLGDLKTSCTGEPAAMNKLIASLKDRLAGDPAAWNFSADEIAARDATRNQAAKGRSSLLEKIRKADPDPSRQAVLILEENSLTLDDWQQAAAVLYGVKFGDKEAEYRNIVINRRNKGERNFDKLDAEWQKRAATGMAKRCRGLSDPDSKSRYPSDEEADFFSIACMRLPELNRELQAEYVAMLETSLRQRGVPESDDELKSTLQVVDDLIGFDTAGAAEWFAKLAAKITPEILKEASQETEFFEVLSTHPDVPALQKAAEALFLAAGSPWNPSKITYSRADELGDAQPLRIPAFRKAFLKALRDNPNRLEVTGSLSVEKEDDDSCMVEWSGEEGSMSMGIQGPCGAKPGSPMKLRRADGLLHAIANSYSIFPDGKEDFPEFRIYWPQDMRDEAIRKWIEHLEK